MCLGPEVGLSLFGSVVCYTYPLLCPVTFYGGWEEMNPQRWGSGCMQG